MQKVAISIFFVVLKTVVLFAQQSIPWDDLKKINELFSSANTYVINSQYSMYKGESKTPMESFSAVVKKSKNNMYYKLGQTEVFVKGSKQFLINHSDKMAVLNNNYKPNDEYYSPQSVALKLEYLKKSNANISYILSGNDGIFKYSNATNKPLLELHYNKTNFYLTKLIVYKDVKSNKGITNSYTIVIDYNNIKLSPDNISDADFSFDKYVVLANGEYKLKSNYSAYKFIYN